MDKEKSLKIFEEKNVRTVWDEKNEKWWFSIVDIVAVLTDSVDPTAYWRKLKQRLIAEGNERGCYEMISNEIISDGSFSSQSAVNNAKNKYSDIIK